MKAHSTVQLQDPATFFDDFIACAKTARSRVWAQAMLFEAGKKISKLEPVLSTIGNRRKLDVRLIIDGVSCRFVHGKLDLLPSLDPKKRLHDKTVHRKTKALLDRLVRNGAKITINNNLLGKIFPLIGRNHIKLFLVDDKTAWVGGMNLTDRAFLNFDFLVKFSNPRVVEILSKVFSFPENAVASKDSCRLLDKNYHLLIDSGRVGKSIIYDKTLQLAKWARRSILYVSQCVPEGRLLALLVSKARNGIPVVIFTSNADDDAFTTFPYKLLYWRFRKLVFGVPNLKVIHNSHKVHAKYLEIDKKESLFGSHNLVWSTTVLATKEIAVHCRDQVLIRQIHQFVYKDISSHV